MCGDLRAYSVTIHETSKKAMRGYSFGMKIHTNWSTVCMIIYGARDEITSGVDAFTKKLTWTWKQGTVCMNIGGVTLAVGPRAGKNSNARKTKAGNRVYENFQDVRGAGGRYYVVDPWFCRCVAVGHVVRHVNGNVEGLGKTSHCTFLLLGPNLNSECNTSSRCVDSGCASAFLHRHIRSSYRHQTR